MAKGGGKTSTNLLRLSGILYGLAGTVHVSRYFLGFEFRIAGFELTLLGSLVAGCLLLLLSLVCFSNSK